ncbi:MAG: YdeI/OmpD-associated family protein [Eubacteriaceae bacterium]|nr:YdeI/OmpD-associated family protein [Eubacteriaceae bacterium]
MDFSKLKRELHPMPKDIEDILNSENLMNSYRSRPAYQQNDYLGWITRAKKTQTRTKRINQMICELQDGNLYMGMKYNTKH